MVVPLHIVREDITRMAVDAIVAAGSAKPGTPKPTGGVNGRIHQIAGERMLAALRRLGGVKTGGATLTEAYDLPCRYVIHTAGPVWQGGGCGEEALLRACYREALALAATQKFETIAFPLISTGQYGYPKAEAMQAATEEIRAFLGKHEMTVYLVVYDREAFRLSGELFDAVEQFIDQHYVDEHHVARNRREEDWADTCAMAPMPIVLENVRSAPAPAPKKKAAAAAPKEVGGSLPPELLRRIRQLDEGFTEMLLRLIDEKGMKDSVCYRRANVDRKLFNKIKNTPGYAPRKSTAAAFCIALELDLPQTRELLSKAGYSMSRSSIFDVVLEYFITRREYDVLLINQVLWQYDQPLLGSNG